jgi:hypothetical protein
MGNRNPYHPRVDTRTGWIFWGEVGPDGDRDLTDAGPAGYDEWNLAKSPGFFGHPYCNGPNRAWGIPTKFTSPYTYNGFYNCDAPVNNSSVNTGAHHLPPSIPSVFAYRASGGTGNDTRFGTGSETAIGGPMYRFRPANTSTTKFPAYYEGKIFFFDFSRRVIRFLTLTYPGGTVPSGTAGVEDFAVPTLPDAQFIDARYAPGGQYEGSLYLLRFGDANGTKRGGLYRIEFTNTSYDNSCYQPFGPPSGITHQRIAPPKLAKGFIELPEGYRTLELFEISGRKVWTFQREASDRSHNIKLPEKFANRLLQARLTP